MARVVRREEADRKKAVLLTARAMQRIDGDSHGARDDALEAVRLAPDLVPAAVTAARALFREDNLRKGSKILEKAWKAKPHPEIAETYVRARIGDSVLDRLKRAEKLEALKPNHIESLLAVAHAALDAQQFERAREKAEAAARQESREGIYLLLADIEEAETGDQGRVRHWLSQAVRAGRDPAWTADGYVSEKWAPISPVTGKLDAFAWRVPLSQLAGPVEEAEARDNQAEIAIRTLPPVRSRRKPAGRRFARTRRRRRRCRGRRHRAAKPDERRRSSRQPAEAASRRRREARAAGRQRRTAVDGECAAAGNRRKNRAGLEADKEPAQAEGCGIRGGIRPRRPCPSRPEKASIGTGPSGRTAGRRSTARSCRRPPARRRRTWRYQKAAGRSRASTPTSRRRTRRPRFRLF